MAETYEPIATTTLGSAATGITFSSIPNTYTDLVLVASINPIASGTRAFIQFNSDTGTNYSRTVVWGEGTASSTAGTTNMSNVSVSPADNQNVAFYRWNIPSYTSNVYKPVLGEANLDNDGSGYVSRAISIWKNTSVISTIYIYSTVSNSFAAGTTATLYGILKA